MFQHLEASEAESAVLLRRPGGALPQSVDALGVRLVDNQR
jgi:hypothetical protein